MGYVSFREGSDHLCFSSMKEVDVSAKKLLQTGGWKVKQLIWVENLTLTRARMSQNVRIIFVSLWIPVGSKISNPPK